MVIGPFCHGSGSNSLLFLKLITSLVHQIPYYWKRCIYSSLQQLSKKCLLESSIDSSSWKGQKWALGEVEVLQVFLSNTSQCLRRRNKRDWSKEWKQPLIRLLTNHQANVGIFRWTSLRDSIRLNLEWHWKGSTSNVERKHLQIPDGNETKANGCFSQSNMDGWDVEEWVSELPGQDGAW